MAQRLPISFNPRIVYRGTVVSVLNECQLMALQFALTGFALKKLQPDESTIVSPSATTNVVASSSSNQSVLNGISNRNLFLSSLFAGAVSAFSAGPFELVSP